MSTGGGARLVPSSKFSSRTGGGETKSWSPDCSSVSREGGGGESGSKVVNSSGWAEARGGGGLPSAPVIEAPQSSRRLTKLLIINLGKIHLLRQCHHQGVEVGHPRLHWNHQTQCQELNFDLEQNIKYTF